MNIFIIGMPKSGRTTIAKSLAQSSEFQYIEASSWVSKSFRQPFANESIITYNAELDNFISNKLISDPSIYIDSIKDQMKNSDSKSFIIDGIYSPHDLIKLFDYNTDYIVFSNRTDNDSDSKDHNHIGLSVIRDYCFWLSSINLLRKEKWIELNFKMNGEDSDFVKTLGNKNSVYIVKNINKATSLLKELIK